MTSISHLKPRNVIVDIRPRLTHEAKRTPNSRLYTAPNPVSPEAWGSLARPSSHFPRNVQEPRSCHSSCLYFFSSSLYRHRTSPPRHPATQYILRPHSFGHLTAGTIGTQGPNYSTTKDPFDDEASFGQTDRPYFKGTRIGKQTHDLHISHESAGLIPIISDRGLEIPSGCRTKRCWIVDLGWKSSWDILLLGVTIQSIMRTQFFSLLFLFLAGLSAAWPWPEWMPDMDSLMVRQDTGDNEAQATPTASNDAARQTTPANNNNNNNNNNNADSDSTNNNADSDSTNNSADSDTPTRASSSGIRRTSAAPSRKTSYDARLPAGGIALLTPAATSTPYFKIGDYVTFAWNYTSLSSTPTALNIMATCSANSQLYTLAVNQTITNATGAVTWDTGSYQATAVQNPLLTQTYTLIIHDVDSSISAPAAAGYLSPFNSYSFGMYVPQPYTPLTEFSCATCTSGALSDLERKALGMVLGMGVLTVLSFTWFVGGTGVIW
ncbi:hypothetical protein LZ554_007128 [Drepanopeziza brunnea f. sp. 'monogermtubi']|nr:hypothetical protein LZ554_007128 [Drepanopeziza brunnea f. sp. 'monogermtubi']